MNVSVVAKDSTEALEGATLQILDKDGGVVAEWSSTKDVYKVQGLKTGVEYTLKETAAPEGYICADDISFTIAGNGELTTTAKTTTDESGSTVLLVETVKITPWKALQAQMAEGGVINLTEDVVADADDTSLVVPKDKTVTLDLKGCPCIRNYCCPLKFRNVSNIRPQCR